MFSIKTIIKFTQEHLVFIIILLLAFIPRVIALNTVPTGLNNDEVDYLINSKLFALTGQGLADYHPPANITRTFPNAEMPSILMSPIVGLLPFSFQTSRLFSVFIGLGIVTTLYLIAKKLLSDKAAFAIGVIAAINPWNIYFSRIVYDAPITTFFLLCGFYALLSQKKWIILSSTVFFLIAFHTYLGMMLIFPFFIISTILFAYVRNRKISEKSPYILVGIFCCLFVLRFALLFSHTANSGRTREIARPTDRYVKEMTDADRKNALVSPFNILFTNKYISFGKVQMSKYFGTFSPELLFISGDNRHIFSLPDHGFFYLIDGIFLLIGFAVLFKNKRSLFYLLLTWSAIAPLPSMISGEGITYAARSYLLQPVFLIYIGSGIWYVLTQCKKTFFRISIVGILILLYGISFSYFAYTYMIKSPITNSEGYNFSARIMAKYAEYEQQKHRNVIVISRGPATAYKAYAYYTNVIHQQNAKEFMNKYKTKNFRINTVISKACPSQEEIQDPQTTIIVEEEQNLCPSMPTAEHFLSITRLTDAGSLYTIYNGQTCAAMTLERFSHDIHLQDLPIDTISEQRFCEKFITQYAL